MAQRIAEHWPGAQLKVLADAAHLANLEQPEAFNRAVLGFLLGPDRS
jgi:pimeloyl-ACP methyl ester carboxylesterase